MTCSKFHTKDPQMSGASVQNLVARATWPLAFVHPLWLSFLIPQGQRNKQSYFVHFTCEVLGTRCISFSRLNNLNVTTLQTRLGSVSMLWIFSLIIKDVTFWRKKSLPRWTYASKDSSDFKNMIQSPLKTVH